MSLRRPIALGAVGALAVAAAAAAPVAAQDADRPVAAQEADEPAGCWIRGERADLELRISPFDSATVALEPGDVKACYSRPRKLGRPIMGRLVPYGEPWRLGANEATAIRVPVRATIAGVSVEPGWYSLYAVPGEREWRIVVNGEARRWGVPIDEDVGAADVGSGTVPVSEPARQAEMLTLHWEWEGPSAAELVVHWDRTAARIPVVLEGTR